MTKDTIYQIRPKEGHDHVCAEIVPIFSHLNHDELLKISKLIHHQHFNKDALLMTPDAPKLLIVNTGKLKIYQLGANGREQLLRVIGAGEFEGEGALFGVDQPNLYAQALSDGTACLIYREDFQKLLLTYPTIGLKLLEESAEKIASLEKQTAFLSSDSIRSRLVSYLLDLAAADDSSRVVIPMKLKELANFIGTTPETLSRTLKKLGEDHLIAYQRKEIQLLDKNRLREEV